MATELKVGHARYVTPGTILVITGNKFSEHKLPIGSEVRVIKVVISDGQYWYRVSPLHGESENWLRWEDAQESRLDEEVEQAVKSIRRSFARPPTRYEEPGASDGNGGPHPLAGVPQEVLDAAFKELKEAFSYGALAAPGDDDLEEVAHSVLLSAIQAAKEW